MAAVPYTVAQAFNEGRPARSGAFVSMGDALYSYALLLAHRGDDGAIILDVDVNAKQQSVTSSGSNRAAATISVPNSVNSNSI